MTSDKHTISGDSRQNSGKYPENLRAGQYRSNTPVTGLQVVSEHGELSETRVLSLAEREVYEAAKRAESSENYDADEGFQLANMNRAIFTTGESNLVDTDNTLENYGKYSAVASAPQDIRNASGRDNPPEATIQDDSDILDSISARKKKLQQRRASRIAAHTDMITTLSRTSRRRASRWIGLIATVESIRPLSMG